MKLDDEDYWAEYDGLQHAKHQLLKSYLGGWFPILTSNKGRVLYIDCNAGRGRHKSGQEGSPLLALNILLTHSCRDQILKNSEVGFIFFEANQHNYNNLCKELAALDSPPDRIHINSFHADYEEVLRSLITDIRSKGITLAPSFGFIDPYGFTISMELMNEILGFPGRALLINYVPIYRYGNS